MGRIRVEGDRVNGKGTSRKHKRALSIGIGAGRANPRFPLQGRPLPADTPKAGLPGLEAPGPALPPFRGGTMQSGSTERGIAGAPDLEKRSPARNNKLEKASWIHWFLLTGGGFLTIVWLSGTTIILLAAEGFSIDQIWPPTAPYLALTLAVMYLLYGAYLTYHQLRVVNRRKDRTTDRLMAILKVTRTLGSESDPQKVFDTITSTCRGTYECDQVSLMVLDEPSRQLEVRSVSGHLHPEEVLGTRMEVGTGVAGWVAEQREAMVLGAKVDHASFPGFQSKSYSISSAMIVPVVLRDTVFGVLSVTSRTRNMDYDHEDLRSLQVFAEYVGICIRFAEEDGAAHRAA